MAEYDIVLKWIEQIKKFCLLREPFNAKKEKITHTLTVKNNAIQQKYTDFIGMDA